MAKKENETGYVYLIHNPRQPNDYKIGMTNDLEERLRTFNSETSCAVPFIVIAYIKTAKYKKVERVLHKIYADARINPKREFFEFEGDDALETVKEMMKDIAELSDGDYQELLTVTRDEEERTTPFSLAKCDIPIGEEIQFINPNDTEVYLFKVHDLKNRGHLENEEGDIMTVSEAVRSILHNRVWSARADMWHYEGRTLKEIFEEKLKNSAKS